MSDFAARLAEEPQALHAEAAQRVDRALARAEQLKKRSSLDGFAMCSDYCFNTGPFLSPRQFGEFVTPYLARLIQGYRDLGFYTVKHTDGNILPILDQLVQAHPHALHSLDPQGAVDIAEVKRRYGDKVCLIGNVKCSALDTGADEEIVESARYALYHGMPGGGYVFNNVHNIQGEVPPENIVALFDTAYEHGFYQ
jgi:uroporphyrinogen decarboxylase